ncbi:MAG: autotransporter-associated beta strand repeat-containing protein, partial [Chthoniobacteraceae bacterium]
MNRSFRHRIARASLPAATVAFLLSGGALSAQTWRTMANVYWTEPSNWGGTVPANNGTADLVFSQVGDPIKSRGFTNMDANWNIRSLTWNSTALDNGKAYINAPSTPTVLTLQSGLSNASGGSVQIYPDVVLAAVQTWNDTNTVDSVFPDAFGTTVYGAISGVGGIQKIGPGTIRLASTSNTFQGGTTITQGILEARDSGSLGAASSVVQINGGTLRLASYPLTAMDVGLDQPVVLGAAGGTIKTRYGATGFTGGISGSGELRLEADESWGTFLQSRYTVSGTNTYSGGTVLGAVTVNVSGAGQALGTGNVTLKDGAVLALKAESNLAAGKKVALQPGSALVLYSAAINPANVIESDPAKTTGGTLSYTVNLSSPLNMATIGNGKLFLGTSGDIIYSAATLGAGSDGIYRVGGGGGNTTLGTPKLTFSGTANLFTGARSVIVGHAGSTLGSDSYGNATVLFNNANNYTGGTTLAAGTLALGHDAALGSGTLTVTGGSQLSTSGGARQIGNAVVFSQADGARFTFGGTDALTLNGAVNLGGTSHVFSSTTARTTFLQPISNGSLELSNGTWTLAATNPFAGGLTISGGSTLDVSSDAQLGGAGGTLTFQGGTLRPTASFNLARPVVLASSGSTFTIDSQMLTLSGTVSGSGAITKNGAGTLAFSGGSKTLGSITINGGLVRLDNTGTNGGNVITVKIGGTLGGNGSVGFSSIAAGGHVAPGTDTPGSLLFNSNLNLNPGSVLDFDLGLSAFDQIILGHGTVVKNAGAAVVVNLADAGGLAPGQTYTLIDWTAANASTVTAANFQLGSSPVGGTFAIVGKTLQLTTVPEPG